MTFCSVSFTTFRTEIKKQNKSGKKKMRKADRKRRKEYDKFYLVRMHGHAWFLVASILGMEKEDKFIFLLG